MNHIRLIRFKNFPDRLLRYLYIRRSSIPKPAETMIAAATAEKKAAPTPNDEGQNQ
jgi:hypothetical protein